MVEGNLTGLADNFQTLDWLLLELDKAKQKFNELAHEKRRAASAKNYLYLASCANAAWAKCEKYYIKADDTAAYYAAIALNPTLKFKWFQENWGNHEVKKHWIPNVKALVEELWLEYKGKRISSQSSLLTPAPLPQKAKIYTSARAHKRLKTVHDEALAADLPEFDRFKEYYEEDPIRIKDDETFDIIQYWQKRYETQPDLARFALDILAVPPMSDECERLFSSAKILLEDRRSRFKMDIVEANEVLRHSYGPPGKDTFDDKGVGEVEGEPQPPVLSLEELRAQRVAARAAAAIHQPDVAKREVEDKFDEEFAAIEGFMSDDDVDEEAAF